MSKPGPRPTPTIELQRRGSWRAKLNKAEPQLDVCVPEPPVWLNDTALQEWNYIAPRLAKGRVLTDWDRNALAGYCQLMADYLEAHAAVERLSGSNRLLTKTANGNIIQNPLVGIRNKAWQMVQKAAAEFGLTPSSRSRIEMQKQDSGGQGKAKFFKAG